MLIRPPKDFQKVPIRWPKHWGKTTLKKVCGHVQSKSNMNLFGACSTIQIPCLRAHAQKPHIRPSKPHIRWHKAGLIWGIIWWLFEALFFYSFFLDILRTWHNDLGECMPTLIDQYKTNYPWFFLLEPWNLRPRIGLVSQWHPTLGLEL